MIEAILPDAVISVEARNDPVGAVLFPAEEALIRNSVEKRRREFTTARVCAHKALAQLGVPATAIATGEKGEPLWPSGVVGSITHCEGYRACAVARSTEVVTVGIDATPHAALPDDVLDAIARPEELVWLHDRQSDAQDVRWDRLLFSAKECIYKAWFPFGRRRLGFEDAVVTFDARAGTFSARMLVVASQLGVGRVSGFSGRWLVCDGLVLTAITLAAPPP